MASNGTNGNGNGGGNGGGNGTTAAEIPPPLTIKASLATFPSIIDTYEASEQEPLNAWLLEEIAKWRSEDEGLDVSNTNGWHSSKTLFKRDEPVFKEICRRIRLALTHTVRRYIADFDPTKHAAQYEGWVNVNGKGAYNMPHAHHNCHISGVYYVAAPASADKYSGAIEFHSPLGGINPVGKLGQRMQQANHVIRPEPGMMILFPAYLRHWVCPNEQDEERVSIAFNFTLPDASLG